MTGWAELDQELDRWQAAGDMPTFWWRDDDTEAATPALDQLIQLAEQHAVPLHLAVIPHAIDPGLKARLERATLVYVMQHGFRHKNHEPKGMRASEVGVSRDLALQKADLAEGWQRLLAAGLPRTLPVFCPPWTRIADKTLAVLPELGFAACSTFFNEGDAPRDAPVAMIDGHIEPIKWKGGARFRGVEKTVAQAVLHLREKREGRMPRGMPTGLVTHHLDTDAETWDFCAAFLERVAPGRRSRWIALPEILEG